jgi:DNA-directed RNA polymerase subunit RPC12/RpoP
MTDWHEYTCADCGALVETTGPESPAAQDGRCYFCRNGQ